MVPPITIQTSFRLDLGVLYSGDINYFIHPLLCEGVCV